MAGVIRATRGAPVTTSRLLRLRLLLVAGQAPWTIALPDLRSRLGAALQLEIGAPDDEMAGELILSLAK